MEESWNVVKRATRVYAPKMIYFNADEIKNIIKRELEVYRFESVVVYGSINGVFKPTSDVDLMIFSKAPWHRDDLRELKQRISKATLRKIDLIFMLISPTGKSINLNDRDELFYNEVYDSGVVLSGSNFHDYMISSKKIGKF